MSHSDDPGAAAPSAGEVAPWWLDLIAVGSAVTVAAVGLVGLLLALAGRFSTPLTLLLALPVATGGILAIHRARRSAGGSGHVPSAVAAVVLAAAYLVFAAWTPAQHVLINRDPGSYTSTARWLAAEGSLEVDAAQGGLASDDPSLRFDSYAVYDTGDGRLQFQFNHLTSVVLAVAYEVGGHRLMFRVPALVAAAGLLVLYCLAVRATRRPWVALVAPALAASTLPLLYVARDTFSEPIMLLLLWGSILAGLIGLRAGRVVASGAAGAVLGAAVATRIDAVLFVAVAFPLLGAAVVQGRAGASRLRSAAAFGLCAVVTASVGLADLQLRSGGYADRHGDQAGLLTVLAGVALVATVVVVALLGRFPRLLTTLRSLGRSAATALAALVVVGLLLAWWIRPEVQVMRGRDEVSLVAALQEMAGVAVDGSRRYGELSVRWLGWYLGPVALLIGIAGLGLVVRRALLGRARAAELVVGAVALACAVYLWRPSIVPDHPWASRRFVPAVLPAFVLTATIALGWFRGRPRPSLTVRRSVVAVAGAVAVLGAAATTWPVRELREQRANLGVLLEACHLAGPDATVVVVGAPMVDVLPQALRSWCGVPVASLAGRPDAGTVERLRDRVEAEGRTLVWVAADEAHLALPGVHGETHTTATVFDGRAPERTLLRVPGGYEPVRNGFSLALRAER